MTVRDVVHLVEAHGIRGVADSFFCCEKPTKNRVLPVDERIGWRNEVNNSRADDEADEKADCYKRWRFHASSLVLVVPGPDHDNNTEELCESVDSVVPPYSQQPFRAHRVRKVCACLQSAPPNRRAQRSHAPTRAFGPCPPEAFHMGHP